MVDISANRLAFQHPSPLPPPSSPPSLPPPLLHSCLPVVKGRGTQHDLFVYMKISESLREGWETTHNTAQRGNPRWEIYRDSITSILTQTNLILGDESRRFVREFKRHSKFTVSLHLFAQLHRQKQRPSRHPRMLIEHAQRWRRPGKSGDLAPALV